MDVWNKNVRRKNLREGVSLQLIPKARHKKRKKQERILRAMFRRTQVVRPPTRESTSTRRMRRALHAGE